MQEKPGKVRTGEGTGQGTRQKGRVKSAGQEGPSSKVWQMSYKFIRHFAMKKL